MGKSPDVSSAGKTPQETISLSYISFFENLSRFGIFYTTLEGEIRYTNPCWSRITGVKKDKALRTHWLNYIHSSDRQRLTEEWTRTIQSKQPMHSNFKIEDSTGHLRDLNVYIHPDKDGRNHTIGFIGEINDFTDAPQQGPALVLSQKELNQYLQERTRGLKETNLKLKNEVKQRKLVAAALRESEERFHLLADAAFEGIIMTDDDLIIDINKQTLNMFQSKRDDFIGKSVDQFITPVSEILLKNRVSIKSETKEEYVAIRKDGTTFPVDLHSREIKFKEKSIRVTIIRDVTEYKYLETAERLAKENMEILRKAMMDMSTDRDLESVLDKVLFFLGKVVPFQRAAVLMANEEGLKMIAGQGFENSESVLSNFLNSIYSQLVEQKQGDQVTVLHHLDEEPDMEPFWKAEGVVGWINVPMKSHASVNGYLTIAPRKAGQLSIQDMDFLQVFANEAAIAIENAQLFEKVQTLAITDPLTGLFNRRHFFDCAEKEWHRSIRYGHTLTTIMVDIDRFKRVNDRFGHSVGDNVLVQLAEACRKIMRSTDILARYGGEEFVILLPETDLAGALDVAERLQQNITQVTIKTKNKITNITVSMGIATIGPESRSIDDLLDHADRALYLSKKQGRNRYTCWSPAIVVPAPD
jgi:diguanylate cyclase (GGDEF)-like protein/PAS domain S-box-containing protein